MTIPRTPSDKLANVSYRRSRGNGKLWLTSANTAIFHTFSHTALQKNQVYRETSASSLRLARTAYSILTLKQHESPEQSP